MCNKPHALPNTYWVRHFLICNAFAKEACENRGWRCENFAQIILNECEGAVANSQMSCYFWAADKILSSIRGMYSKQIFEGLENDHDISIDALANLSNKQIENMYRDYCTGKIQI